MLPGVLPPRALGHTGELSYEVGLAAKGLFSDGTYSSLPGVPSLDILHELDGLDETSALVRGSPHYLSELSQRLYALVEHRLSCRPL